MSHVQYLDELIREFLLFRGFSGTVKAFDTELKVDKDKSFRVSNCSITKWDVYLWLKMYICFSTALQHCDVLRNLNGFC
jgi:hypothetical protein